MSRPGLDPESPEVLRRLAARAGLRYEPLDPERNPPDPRAAALLEPPAARGLGVVPLRVAADETLVVATSRPDPFAAVTIHALTGRRVEQVIAGRSAIARAQARVYGSPAERPRVPLRPSPPAPTDEDHYRRLAQEAGLEYVELDPDRPRAIKVNETAAQLLPERLARRFGLLPVSVHGHQIVVATSTPADEIGLRLVRALTGLRPRAAVASPDAIARAIDRTYAALAQPLESALPSVAAAPARRARMLGSLLLETGLVDPEQLGEALDIQARTGARLGEVLLHAGAVDEKTLTQLLAHQLRLPHLDVSAFEPEEEALAIIPEPIARRFRFVPLTVRNGVLFLAMADPLDDVALAHIREYTELPVRAVVTTRTAVDTLLQRLHAQHYVKVATAELVNRSPDESAYRVLTLRQRLVLLALVVLWIVLVGLWPVPALIVTNVISFFYYVAFSLYKSKLVFDALRNDLELPVSPEEVAALDERTLPTYTILVPLYRETAVVERLTEAIARIDYPRTKLDVKLILEEDDVDTIGALRSMHLPAHFKLVVVPDAPPKTKPKACNYGLIHAEGRYVVIYDAEDLPEPDQLKKVVVAFRKAEQRIVCIQCKLNYYNREQNVLTRWFTSEYSNWFDLVMPGLDAADAPIPLGGTSNHFETEKLLELGAWDPFNVTEDADLGIRLHKAGYKTAIIDSTTFEEANSELYNWVRQRSRWVKGYVQTWLVHMRHPIGLWKQIGWRSWFSFQFMIGGTFFGFLVNPFYWLLTTIWALTQASLIRSFFPSYVYFAAAVALFLGNFVFVYVNVAGAMRRRYFDLVKFALLSPLYWALMSVGAWKGLMQLFYEPFYWEKTVHGLDVMNGERRA